MQKQIQTTLVDFPLLRAFLNCPSIPPRTSPFNTNQILPSSSAQRLRPRWLPLPEASRHPPPSASAQPVSPSPRLSRLSPLQYSPRLQGPRTSQNGCRCTRSVLELGYCCVEECVSLFKAVGRSGKDSTTSKLGTFAKESLR